MDRLAAMEAFIRVVDAGSFSDAAKQLRIGQPAASKTIAQLEDWLGVRLLRRSTHRLTPTEAGRNFYDRAKRAIEEADEVELAARGAAATLSGRMRFCGPLTFTRLLVMPCLSTFLTEHPSLDIDVVLEDRGIDEELLAPVPAPTSSKMNQGTKWKGADSSHSLKKRRCAWSNPTTDLAVRTRPDITWLEQRSPELRSRWGLVEFFQERSCRFQVGRFEPFDEPVVDWLENCRRVGRTALIAREPQHS